MLRAFNEYNYAYGDVKPGLVKGKAYSFDLQAYKAYKMNHPDDRNV